MFLESYGPAIAACYACATVCERCAVACLDDDDPQTMGRCITLGLDCAQMCRTAAAMMSRHSEFVDTICETCGEMCSACAVESSHHNTQYCRQCAEACQRCARLCREVAQQTQGRAAYA